MFLLLAICSGERRRRSPSRVALTALWGLTDPRHFGQNVSGCRWPPGRARTGPPAITPVPGSGRLHENHSGAVAADHVVGDRMGIGQGNGGHVLLGRLNALADGLGEPRWPCPGRLPPCPGRLPPPHTAAKEKRRPPLTTLATRLMLTTLSIRVALRSRSHGASALVCSKLKPPFASSVGHGLYPTVIEESVAVKDDFLVALLLGLLGDEEAHIVGGPYLGLGSGFGLLGLFLFLVLAGFVFGGLGFRGRLGPLRPPWPRRP